MMTRLPNRPMQTRTWEMSFNDLLTVLLTFFILLVSISHLRLEKVQDLSSSAIQTFGEDRSADTSLALIGSLSDFAGIRVNPIAGGIELVLPESLVYGSGSADIVRKDLLRQLATRLKDTAADIRIEGHTDNVPVATSAFPSNWELSAQRASNAVRYITEECGINPQLVSAAGYADSRPVATNDSAEGRALNRRVNLIITLK